MTKKQFQNTFYVIFLTFESLIYSLYNVKTRVLNEKSHEKEHCRIGCKRAPKNIAFFVLLGCKSATFFGARFQPILQCAYSYGENRTLKFVQHFLMKYCNCPSVGTGPPAHRPLTLLSLSVNHTKA